MPPKRSTRAAAAATKPATQTRTTRAGPSAAPSPAAKAAVAAARTATTTSKTAAPSRKTKKAPTSAAPRQQLDGAADDDDIETSNGSGSANNDSGADDSDTLAISNRPARLFRRANRDTAAGNDGISKAEDYVMTGALGEGDVAGAHVAAMQKKGGGRNVRTRGRMRGAGAGGVTKQRTAARDPEQARALEALRRRREEAMGGAVAAEPAAAVEREEEDKERGRKQEVPGTASRGTPAAERSVLALTKFQKRRRQGSLLRMMQQSDVEDNTDGDSGDVDDSAATLDYSLGDFEPDHESTPLNLGRKGSIAAALPGSDPRTSSSRKRKLAEREETEEISMVQVPRSSPPPAAEDQEVVDGEETSSEHLYSEASELPEAIADTQPEAEEAAANKTLTESIAPPRSTSPLSSLPAEPEPEEVPAKRPRRAAARPATSYSRTSQRVSNVDAEDHGADPLSTSELESDTATETPARTRTSRKKPNTRKVKALPLSTATLQSLLPRRRKKPTTRAAKIAAGGTFEIPSSSDAEEEEIEQESADEDELQRPPAAAKRGRGRKNVAGKASDSTVRASKKQSAAAKEKNKKRLSRTYGRRSSDKENQDAADTSMYVRSGGESDGDDDDNDVVETSEMREMKRSKELEAAARKFKEVDDWEMEFESVDMGGGGASASSPWR
ncbi:hypothetical protein SLS58_006719 [Diplodia intermedia]|uniref:Uncharacterized protein n=1 Tax=Diplodia intermedia TaxID=856260 RepID=A0ABR3TMU7_9PEZI